MFGSVLCGPCSVHPPGSGGQLLPRGRRVVGILHLSQPALSRLQTTVQPIRGQDGCDQPQKLGTWPAC